MQTDNRHAEIFSCFASKNMTKFFSFYLIQPISVGVFRSDYMVNYDADSTTPTLKQIEVNTISASFFGLANQVADLHR